MTQAISTSSPARSEAGAPPMAVKMRFNTEEKLFVVDNDQSRQAEIPRCRHTAAARLAATLDYMRAHLDQPMTVSTLSAMIGLSQSSFFELFRKATRDTPLNWFIRARMRRACELLEQTDLPIKQIAAQVGYQDPLYFSRVFKFVGGIPPTEYRARMRRKQASVAAA